jgi:FtsP/CotA-like multicopper oxidase with cupredoxin domain
MAPATPATSAMASLADAGAAPPALASEWPAAASRRAVLGAGVALGATAVALSAARLRAASAQAQAIAPPATSQTPDAATAAQSAPANALRIPPLYAPEVQDGTRTYNLVLQQGQFQFVPGQPVPTLGINGSYLGPTLRAKQGDLVALDVANRLGEATTLHWHGMHVPAAMDGGPHQIIAPDGEWHPRFAIRQRAATLWYHSHLMGMTRQQVTRGLAGMFILDDDNLAQDALPHTYGVDDLPLILQDDVFDGGPQFGPALPALVNGSLAPSFTTAQPRLRLRVLNASAQRLFVLGFADDRTFYQVASDGGLLPAPVPLTRLQIGPAERAELVVDLAPLEPAQPSPPALLQHFRRGGADTLLSIAPADPSGEVAALPPLPAQLNAVDRLSPDLAAVTRDFVLGGGGGLRTINGHAMASMDDVHDMANTLRVRLGDVEVWNVINTTRQTHLFHVHDVQFQILDRSRAALAANEMGRKDTVVVNPGETVRIIMRFADYADPEAPYMFHCHILQHEDQGMMGQFVVVPA